MVRCRDFLTGVESADIGVEVRPARAGDLHELVALDRLCFGSRAWASSEWWEAILDPALTTLIGESRGSTVAAMVLLAWPPHASLASIAVHPDWRGRGVGRSLLRLAIDAARRAGARTLDLEVDADNRNAIGLYRQEGWTVQSRLIEDGRPRLSMTRRIARRRRAGKLL